jgi:hypothetical protein
MNEENLDSEKRVPIHPSYAGGGNSKRVPVETSSNQKENQKINVSDIPISNKDNRFDEIITVGGKKQYREFEKGKIVGKYDENELSNLINTRKDDPFYQFVEDSDIPVSTETGFDSLNAVNPPRMDGAVSLYCVVNGYVKVVSVSGYIGNQ